MAESRADFYKTNIIISLFIVFFLFIYKPFDLSNAESNLLIISIGFGLMTLLGTVIFDLFIRHILKVEVDSPKFTFSKWILYMFGIMFFISLFNFLFARLYFFGDIQWIFFPYMIRSTFLIGLFPVVFVGFLTLLRNENKYMAIAKEINDFPSKNAEVTDSFTDTDIMLLDIPINKILYLEAMQNYVKIGYLNSEHKSEEKIERTTLKSMIKEINYDSIIRCHRSFLVNKKAITSISGNAQGLQLTLSDCEKIIPVSRSFVQVFR